MTPAFSGLPSPANLNGVQANGLYIIPRAFVSGGVAHTLIETGHALPFLSGNRAFAAVEVVIRKDDGITRCTASVTAFNPWLRVINPGHREVLKTALDRMAIAHDTFAGLSANAPKIMGIVNVTPDSFSDGGDHATSDAAISHGLKLLGDGADILDVGGESTRPGADPVDPSEEQRRVLPVIKALAEKGCCVSVDTRHASTMAAAIEVGASIVNDVTALKGDPASLGVVTQTGVPVVLMHMQGEPRTMQSDPSYDWAPIDVFDELARSVEQSEAAGLQRRSICIDPGIGFGKTLTHNIELLDSLSILLGLGCPVLVGASRKRFIGELSETSDPKRRGPGSLAAALKAVEQGAQIVRVHDVVETRQALAVTEGVFDRLHPDT